MTLREFTSETRSTGSCICTDCHERVYCGDGLTVNVRWTLGRHGLHRNVNNFRHSDCAKGLRQLAA